jgi:Protein of unknown function (DUF3352)
VRRLPRPRLPRPGWLRLRRPGWLRLRRLRWLQLPRPSWLYLRRPSWPYLPRPRVASIIERLREAGYAVEDAAFAAGRVARRVPAAIGRGSREFWFDLSIPTRLRLILVLGVVVALALVWLVAVPALPCGAPGGDRCPPADDAIHLVPEDALAYAHLNVDPDTEQYEDAAKVFERVPGITKQASVLVLARLPGPNGAPPDFERDIEPWFGGEAALAIVPAGRGGRAEEVQLLEASDDERAREFADSIAAGKPRSQTYRDVEVRIDRRGLATALVAGFLVIGAESGVRDAIDAESGAKGTGSLAGDPKASGARNALPDKRLADAYLSADGIAELVADPRGPLATLASVINPDASRGAAVALVAGDDGLDLDLRSVLGRRRAKAHPGFFSAFPSFQPDLAGSLPGDSLAYVGIGDPGKTLRSLLKQASAQEPGLAAAVDDLLERVRKLGEVDLEKDLLPSLGGEAAITLQPALPGSRIPFLEFIAADVDADRASQALARLQGPIAQALNPSRGLQAPVVSQRKVGGLTAHSVRVSPTVDLTYAIEGSTLVVATDPAAVEQLASGEGGLDGGKLFDRATDGFPGEVSMLGYLDLGGLIALAESAGLGEDPAYLTFASEIHKLQALGLAVQSSPEELSTDARLIVGGGAGSPPKATPPEGVAPTD